MLMVLKTPNLNNKNINTIIFGLFQTKMEQNPKHLDILHPNLGLCEILGELSPK